MIYSRPMVNHLPWRLWIAALVLAAYWLALFAATHLPGKEGGGAFLHWDKVAHFCAYFGLAVLLAWVLAGSWGPRWPVYAVVFGIIAGYGALDEGLQRFVPGRSADLYDWLADMAGGICGLVVHRVAMFILKR